MYKEREIRKRQKKQKTTTTKNKTKQKNNLLLERTTDEMKDYVHHFLIVFDKYLKKGR